jgi:Ras-related protein Rab-7A
MNGTAMNGPNSRKKAPLKVVVIGDSSVGKTSLLNQYVNKRYTSWYQATMAVDFLAKNVVIDNRVATLQIVNEWHGCEFY